MTKLVHRKGIRLFAVTLLLTVAFGAGVRFALADLSADAESNLPGPAEAPAGSTESQSEMSATNAEGQAATNEPGAAGAVAAPQAQQYLFIAGSNFRPRDSAATFSYTGGGCTQRNSNTGDSWFTTQIQLPDGATINSMTVYFLDNNVTYDINSELWNFNGAGGTNLLAEADSSGSPGYSSTSAPAFSHVVNNSAGPLSVVASIQGGVGSSLALCGLRIGYDYSPLATNYLPAVLREP
ncbi:MAG: hypothetical protein KDE59_12950 [Anaerolineales bacterium]|nr:hypothetical protein [Anaerolineales bacterium]